MAFGMQNNEKYQRIIEGIRTLPSLPEIAARLMSIVNSADTSADDAASLIQKDPGLTSMVLRMANSAFYGMPRTTSSVSSAVVILGFNTIRTIVLSASIMKAFPPGTTAALFSHERFWRHSILCAVAAKYIAKQRMHVHSLDPESAFCAGILHDIGRLIFAQYVPEEFAGACRLAAEKKIPLVMAEKEILGITHAETGSIIADKWALPFNLEQALVAHHNPERTEGPSVFVAALHCADALAHHAGADLWDGEVAGPVKDEALAVLGLHRDDCDACLDVLRKNSDTPMEFLAMVDYAG